MDTWLLTAQNDALEVWFVTALAVAAVLAWGGRLPFAGQALRVAGHLPIAQSVRQRSAAAVRWFADATARVDGRVLAVGWLILLVLAIGDGGLIWGWPPVVQTFLVLQQLAGPTLVPWTAALYLYKGAVPQLRSDEVDEREVGIQGRSYRLAHHLLLAAFVTLTVLLVFNPAIGWWLARVAESRQLQLIDIVLPLFLVVFLLPSVAYAWQNNRPEPLDAPPDSAARGSGLAPAAAA